MSRPGVLRRIVLSVALLPFVWIGFYAVGGSLSMFRYNVLSGRFITDETIVPGGALDQSGLTKVAVVLVLGLGFHISVLAVRRMWLRTPPRWVRIALYAPLAGLLIPQMGLWISYHWYLIRYIHAMGWTFHRLLGLVGGMTLFAGCAFLLARLVRRV